MPPSKPRPMPEDSRSETSSTKEKVGTTIPSNGKARRVTSSAAIASSLRDVVTVGTATTTVGAGTANSDANPGVRSKYFVELR